VADRTGKTPKMGQLETIYVYANL